MAFPPVNVWPPISSIQGKAKGRGEEVLVRVSLDRAERMLDWLENQGCTDFEAKTRGETVTIRFCCPPGSDVVKDEQGTVWLVKSLPTDRLTDRRVS